MSAVSLLSSLREKPAEDNKNHGSDNKSHEDNGILSCAGGDPAVLAVGPARRTLTYTIEQLLNLRNSPLVKRNLETAFAGCDALALVLKKRSESPNEEDRGAKGDVPNENHKIPHRERERRSADPRERVRKESETSGSGAGGIVLSPQRRSFTSGCGAPCAAPAQPPHVARTRPDSPLSTAATAQAAQPKTEQAGRRIGSGRIMVRDVQPGSCETEFRSEPYRPPHRERDRDHRTNGDRLERRSYGRDSYMDRYNDKPRDREDHRRSGGRYNQRRYDKEDEPEWFSAGPTSQLDTIELRGFDEPTKTNGSADGKDEKWNGDAPSSGDQAERNEHKEKGDEWQEASSHLPNNAHSTNTHGDIADPSNNTDLGVDSKKDDMDQNDDHPEFNLDDFLKFDSIPDVLTNGGAEMETGSRFSRWFRRDSPTNDKHYEQLLNNMVDDLDSTTRMESEVHPMQAVGNESQQHQHHVFAPISPANGPPRPLPHAPSLLDMLLRSNEIRPDPVSNGGKIHSLEELESRLRPHPPHQQAHNVPEHDLTAFKRLLAQVSGGQAIPAAGEPGPRQHPHPHHQLPQTHSHPPPHPHPPQQQPMSLLQMLSKSVEQQQQQQKAQQQHQQQQQQQQAQQPHIPQELLYKLLQVQQRQQQNQQPPVNEMGHVGVVLPQADRELLQRPEAQAIVQGLKTGDINVQNLMQQLNNPGMQSRHREIILTILRYHQQQKQQQMGGSPLPGAVGNASHLIVPPHHQPLRLSPVAHQGGVPTRIPSPRELAVHTQSIMQSALIKKKLEEQRENYRRRHEMQQQQQQHQHQQQLPKQPTPISFTPTSVLRKMTAEKESDSPSPKQQQQWSHHAKLIPQGRPIVKGNQSGNAMQMGYSGPTQAEYQQHYLNQQQQQMASGIRPFTIPQQRQQVPANSINNMARGMAGGTTLHQLLVQTHQRSLNDMGGGGGIGGTGGGDNQLARWFSPELLAQASAGKLPSVHVPNALSLEDLERHHHSPAPPLRN